MSEPVAVEALEPAITPAWEPTTNVKIADVRAICTAPDGIRLVVVKVETTEPGLYGVGDATFTQRPLAVVSAIDDYLRPFLVGRSVDDIGDIWQAAYVSSYWRSGPVLNNALSGVDMALWDIKGKRAGMPLYQLFGGKVRRAAPVYLHATARDFAELEGKVSELLEAGFSHFRLHSEVPGYTSLDHSLGEGVDLWRPLELEQAPWEPRPYVQNTLRMFDHVRSTFGDDIELIHDVHERVPPIMALQLAKDLEPYKLFYLEDVVAPEDGAWLRLIRGQSSTPIAMGELYVNPNDYVSIIGDRLIDFIRVHLSDIGGLTPARKLTALSEYFGVRTAWHGPDDTAPPGLAANLHLDLSSINFGIQEQVWPSFSERLREVFPGCPEIRDGMLWCNELPGLGVDVDELAAARYPFPDHAFNGAWPEVRRADGAVLKP